VGDGLFRRADARRRGGPVKPGHDTVGYPSTFEKSAT